MSVLEAKTRSALHFVSPKLAFIRDALTLDTAAEIDRIVEAPRKQVLGAFRRLSSLGHRFRARSGAAVIFTASRAKGDDANRPDFGHALDPAVGVDHESLAEALA